MGERVKYNWFLVFLLVYVILPPSISIAKPVGIALVLGNSAYQNYPLDNPVPDARAVAKSLKALGFDVIDGFDLDLSGMERKLSSFGHRLLDDGSIGLFYYAGHAVQVDGQNYLLPITGLPKEMVDLKYDALPLGKVLERMRRARNDLNIVLFDACRDNPYKNRSRSYVGGAANVDAARGDAIIFATEPGSVAKDGTFSGHSPFTAALLQALKLPDLSVYELYQNVLLEVRHVTNNEQWPWMNTSYAGNFRFGLSKFGRDLSLHESILNNLHRKRKAFLTRVGREPKISFISADVDHISNGDFRLSERMRAQIKAYHTFMIERLHEKGNLNLAIQGWAVASGSSDFEQKLSETCAKKVHEYLDFLMTDKQKNSIKIDVVGMGRNGSKYRYVTFVLNP